MHDLKPSPTQFFTPKFRPGEFPLCHGVRVKVVSLRWDDAHREFQYLVQAKPRRDTAVWVSEREVQ